MGECQQPFQYSENDASTLEALLSSRRFGTYLRAAGFNVAYAFELYLYNARLAKAFLFPLHVVEVLLRNAIDEVLSSRYSSDWPDDQALYAIMPKQSLASLMKAKERAKTSRASAKKDDVISCLTFDFWSNLFRHEYDRALWQTNMNQLLPASNAITRAQLQSMVMGINHFRNRIAHHEPIFRLDVSSQYKAILNVVGYRSAVAAQWLKSHSTVNKVMRSRPASGHGPGPASSTLADSDFICMANDSSLAQLPSKKPRFITCMHAGIPVGVLGMSDIGRYMLDRIDETGLLDANEHRLEDVLRHADGKGMFVMLEEKQSTAELAHLLRGATRFALVVNQSNSVQGVIAKAHRRY
jgi:hypothetical protein